MIGCTLLQTVLSMPPITAGKIAGFNAKSENYFNLLESMTAFSAQFHRLVIVFKDLLIDAILVSSKTLLGFYCKQQGLSIVVTTYFP